MSSDDGITGRIRDALAEDAKFNGVAEAERNVSEWQLSGARAAYEAHAGEIRSRRLDADPGITCQWDVPYGDGETWRCGVLSRFVVSRSDGDQSFGWDGKHESCEAHLGEVVASMIDGDDTIKAVVAIRWDVVKGKGGKP